MNILITGGTGLVGKFLTKKLRTKGHEVRILTRSKSNHPDHFFWNLDERYIDKNAFDKLDVIIHLAGASISEKWTESYKKELFSSRIDSANLLLEHCIQNNTHIKAFISASGINYYGTFTSNKILTENQGIQEADLLSDLCEQWENAAENFSQIADRIVCLRTSVVLDKNEGAFPLLKKTVDLNIGSAVGTGKQWMNWIHIEDLANMYVFAVENSALKGKFNAVADDLVTNKSFMKTLSIVSNKFFLPFNVPSIMLKTALGEMSSIILEGTRASNEKIKSQGFDFKYSELEKALKSLL